MPKVALTSLVAAICAMSFFAAGASAAPAEYAGSSASGNEVFFTTAEKMVAGDTDNGFVDVYERFYDGAKETYVTREISTGPTGGNDSYDVTFGGVSSDGTKVFFSTAESLTDDDHDRARDIYERNTTTGDTLLVSGSLPSCAPCGNREIPVTFAGSTATGSKVFFTTAEKLVGTDSDEVADVYMRDLGEAAPKLASPGGASPAAFDGASADGNRIAFETIDKLDGADTDTETDVYERDLVAGTTKLVSGGPCPAPLPQAECVPAFRAITSDGSIFLQTKAQMTGEDEDVFQDVYQWAASTGSADLVSTSDAGEEGDGTFNAIYAGIAADGGVAFFETDEKLADGDDDESNDVYSRSGGVTSLVSPGSEKVAAVFNGASADGGIVLFSTREALADGDSGSKLDVYARSGATTTLVSPGSPSFDVTFVGSSPDASDVFYVTSQPVTAADLDEKADIYEVSDGGPPVLVSFGPAGGNGAFTAHLADVSADGSHAFFTTRERLTVDDDFATENDVYDHAPVGTLLVSAGNSGQIQLGPPIPVLKATDPASPDPSLEPRIIGEAELGTSIKIYPTVDCSGAPAEVGSAAELDGSGIAVKVKEGSTTSFHATATNSSGDTSDCSPSSVSYTQQNTAPPPEEGPGSGSGDGSNGGSGGGSTGSGPTAGGGTGSAPSGGSGTPVAIRIGGVVYVEPATRITFGPLAKTRSRSPVFRFLDTTEQPNTSFLCRVDRKAWKGCSSPFKAKGLKLGKHVFAVKGKSFAGQWERQPVVRRFKVVAK